MEGHDDTDDSEYRPTDWLANCGMSYGVGTVEEQAIMAALEYAGPWDGDRDKPVTVSVWELYADSWETCSPRGPERGADWLSLKVVEIPAEEADRVAGLATDATVSLDRALAEAETVEEQEPGDE